jgi:trehalose synthase-fused probable maltokinase
LDSATRTLIERDALMPFLQRQRWYAGKARQARRARFADWALLDATPPLFLCIIEVEYEGGASDRYVIVLAAAGGDTAQHVLQQRQSTVLTRLSGARTGVLYDGLTDPAVIVRLLALVRRGGTISLRSGTVKIEFADPSVFAGDGDSPVRVHIPLVEQSNSSILIGEKYLLKVFRRLALGENPDIEVGRTLGARANEARVPTLLAWAQYQAEGSATASLAMVQQQVPSRGSAWQHALDEVRAFCDRAMVTHRSGGAHAPISAEAIEDTMGSYRAAIELLGKRTADLHRTMAGLETDGFGVHAYAREDLERLVRDLKGHAARALDIARDRRATLLPEAAAKLDHLLTRSDTINDAIERVLTARDLGKRIRTHSDFHLGQVLEVEGDVFFIDFEGEPARPIAERRVPQSPLRDVAGMIRSLGYAANAGLKTHLETHPDTADILRPWINGWELHAAAIYIAAYLKGIADTGLLPTGTDRDLLLRALLLDKAFYELSYELNNRPDWADIPLNGLLRLLEPAPAPTVSV